MGSEMYPLFERTFMDDQTTMMALKKQVSRFRDERNWLKDDLPRI